MSFKVLWVNNEGLRMKHTGLERWLEGLRHRNKCKIASNNDKPWLVQLDIGTKQKVSEIVKDCEVNLNGFPTKIKLKSLPL